MDWYRTFQTAGVIVIFLTAVGAGFGSLWYMFRSKQLKELREEVGHNKELLDECEIKHKTNEKRIEELEAKIDNTINIPLNEISIHMKKTNTILSKLIKVQ